MTRLSLEADREEACIVVLREPGRYVEAAATRYHPAADPQSSHRTAGEEVCILEEADWGCCSWGLPSTAGLQEAGLEEEPSTAFQYRARNHVGDDDVH